MASEIKRQLRTGATVLALLIIAPGCGSSLPSGANGGGGGGGTQAPTGSGGATGGTLGARCDYQNPGVTCPSDQGCLWECFGDSSRGECVPLPAACDAALSPVCGCDGKTYGNECLLQQAAMRKDHDGRCLFGPADDLGYVQLHPGVWSGTGIRMNVSETGAAISLECMSGTIGEPLNLARRSYTVAGPLPRYGSWQGTLSGGSGVGPVPVMYEARLSDATLMLSVMDRSWTLRYEDAGAPTCP